MCRGRPAPPSPAPRGLCSGRVLPPPPWGQPLRLCPPVALCALPGGHALVRGLAQPASAFPTFSLLFPASAPLPYFPVVLGPTGGWGHSVTRGGSCCCFRPARCLLPRRAQPSPPGRRLLAAACAPGRGSPPAAVVLAGGGVAGTEPAGIPEHPAERGPGSPVLTGCRLCLRPSTGHSSPSALRPPGLGGPSLLCLRGV